MDAMVTVYSDCRESIFQRGYVIHDGILLVVKDETYQIIAG